MSGVSMQHITPVLPTADVDATAGWYRDVLGFDAHTFPNSSPSSFAILSREGVEIFLQRVEGYRKPDLSSRREGGVWDAYIQVDDVAPLWEGLAGLPGARGPEERIYGQREIEIRDPEGHVLVFAERTEGTDS